MVARIRRGETSSQPGIKTEPPIISRISQYKHQLPPMLGSPRKSGFDQAGGYALAAESRQHSDGRKPQCASRLRHARQKNVSRDLFSLQRDKGDDCIAITAQRIHKIGLIR